MKTMKQLFLLLSICMTALGFYACDKEGFDDFLRDKDGPGNAIWDFSPIQLYFTLTGEDGEDLLNPATPGSYAGLSINAMYEEKTYEKDVFEDNNVPPGRALVPIMYGLYTTESNDGRYALKFGGLNGGKDYEDATIVLHWGDDSQDIITFSSTLTWKDQKPQFKRTFKVNGETAAENTNNPVIDIKKKALESRNNQLDGDVSPIVFNIYLTDTLGNNLLNKSKDKYADRDSVKAIFRGEEYYININASNTPSLTLANYPQTMSPHPLQFGALDGTETFEDENLIMDWGSLGKDTITFTSKITWENNRPIFVRQYSLNGKEVEKDLARPYIRIKK